MLSNCVNYKNFIEINLADNALEDDGVRAVKEFLWENSTLQVLNLNNTKLNDKSCKLLAGCIEKNKKGLSLKSFHIGNNEFTDVGLEDLRHFIESIKTIEVLDVSYIIKVDRRKPFKYEDAMQSLFNAILSRKAIISSINISGNHGINDKNCFDQFKKILFECKKVRSLNISTMGMSKSNCKELVATFLKLMNFGWNVDNNLRELIWNDDLKKSPSSTLKFLSAELPKIYNIKLKTL